MNVAQLSRRQFLKGIGITGGGLVIGFSLTGCGGDPLPVIGDKGDYVPNAFLQITPRNEFIFYCARDEMGQGVSTGLATLLGEELDVSPDRFDIRFPGVHPDYGHPAFGGVQSTGGSASIRGHFLPMRQTGANVRAQIVNAASMDLGVPVADIETEDGHILAGGNRYPYAQFIATAETLTVPEEAPLKVSRDFSYIGKESVRLDGVEKSTGTAVYGIDIDLPDMYYALVKRCPVYGGKVKRFDQSKAEEMPGVTEVVQVSSGIAVVAKTFWQAKQALAQLAVEWDLPELARLSTDQVKADYQQALDETSGNTTEEEGDLSLAFREDETVVESDYWTPYLAHAPLEPMNAIVRIENGEVDVWTGVQGPIFAQGHAARALDIDKDKVRVHNTQLGGGFGRRLAPSHVGEAAEIAAATGKTIKLTWTREDDIQHGVFRPASLMRIKASLNAGGIITGWKAKRVGGNILPDRMASALPGVLPSSIPDGMLNSLVSTADSVLTNWMVDTTSIEGLAGDYDFPNRQVEHVTVNHGLPLSFWRSVGHSYTAFAKECVIDELAHTAGVDAVEMRLENTRNNPRLNRVIEIAGDRMKSWQPTGSLGFASHASFYSYAAQVADVSVDSNVIRVNKVLCVIDCGQVINPDIVRAQMEGAVVFGLTAALHGELSIENGAIKQSNFHDYPMLRMNESPDVEVIIVESIEDPTGVGEVGLPPVAPAVANAVFAATGRRLTSLPLKLT